MFSQKWVSKTLMGFFGSAVCVFMLGQVGSAAELKRLSSVMEEAEAFGTRLEVPPFETTPDMLRSSVDEALDVANARLDALGALSPDEVNFANTIVALDDIGYAINLVYSRVNVIKLSSQSLEMRDVATELQKRLGDWWVEISYREDVYNAVKAYADTNPELVGEDAKLLKETVRDFKRDGLNLPLDERRELEELQKTLSRLSTDFSTNIRDARHELVFTKEQLAGVPESFLGQEGVRISDDEYHVLANVTYHFLAIMENCSVEETRHEMKLARYNLAREQNAPLLQEIVELRAEIAKRLGYNSWADYRTEVKMAGDGETALQFVEDLTEGLQPKFEAEFEEYRKLKVEETGDPNAEITFWDWRYFKNQLKKERYSVDEEALRVYFPYEQTLQGMFSTYEHCFGLKIEEVEPPYKWIDDLTLHLVSDAKTGQPLGLVYLDMFPREGKYNHFAQFGLIAGKRLEGGIYQRPTVALICNFPSPQGDEPALLSHGEVETLFHEFGHVLHSVLTQANYARFSGTSVPRDFVEAPSQMLERWTWDKEVLDTFAADYRDSSKKIPDDLLGKMKEARLGTIATHYRRQLSFGMLDLRLHSEVFAGSGMDVIDLSNEVIDDVFLPVPEDTTFATYFGHLMGYDAGYYGYAWADAIASDLATEFEESPGRFLDVETGMRLRNEVYAPGSSRPIEDSIRAFLGRERSIKPFLKEIGIDETEEN